MLTTMKRVVLTLALLFACSAQAEPTVIACRHATYDMKGQTDWWWCVACVGQICSAAWLSDIDQSGTYE